MRKPTYRWTRLAPARWEDVWVERLRFVGPGKLAVISRPGSRWIRIEAYCDRRTADALVRRFGGALRPVAAIRPAAQRPERPVSIRGLLTLHADEASFRRHRSSRSLPLLVPAGMAFGTGAHATTQMVLRMLCDLRLPAGFRGADLGAGTGVIAMAMERLGAASVAAIDNDPDAVRTARANFHANGCHRCRVRRADVLTWEPQGHCAVVAANLFSDLLARAAPALAAALAPGGTLLYSGVLAGQAPEVADALASAGLRLDGWQSKGKWTAGAATKPDDFPKPSARGRGSISG